MKSLWLRFTAWLSGWPESSEYGRNDREQDYLFAEAEAKIRENNKNIGKKPKKVNKTTTNKKAR
tara:strand:- start:104 stop:295 length:192 start_codon:yes stop_codon:yes gene_type:complete